MTIAVKVLAQGQLPNVKGTLYTVPAATTAYVKFLSLNNTSGSSENTQILVNTAGTSRRIAYATLATNETARVVEKDEVIILETGDLLEGFTTTAAVVDYVVTGAEET